MSEMSAPVRVKVDGPGGLAAAVPHLFGFHPRESLVLVALKGARRRVVFQLRVDLADLGPRQLEDLVLRLRHAEAEEVIALLYTEDDDSFRVPGMPHEDTVDDLRSWCDGHGLVLTDALLVRSGRWWSYLCDDPACCPAEGTAMTQDVTETEVAAAVQLGQATLPDREALAATIAPYDGILAAAMDQTVDRVAAVPLKLGVAEFAALAGRTFGEIAQRFAAPPAVLKKEEAALLLLGLSDIRMRDDVAGRCVAVGDDGSFPLLQELCRLAPRSLAAPPYTLLAAAAYSRGNGALAAIALGHALAADPTYSLARLLDDALQRQLPPSLLRAAWRPSAAAGPRRRSRGVRRD
jgi:hypothetical protein